jgi:hypothetical protein
VLALPWQIVVADGDGMLGTPTVGVIVTVLITCDEGLLQPFAVTWMFTLPENPLAQVMIPVVDPMLPAKPLLMLQLNPVLFDAVVA